MPLKWMKFEIKLKSIDTYMIFTYTVHMVEEPSRCLKNAFREPLLQERESREWMRLRNVELQAQCYYSTLHHVKGFTERYMEAELLW